MKINLTPFNNKGEFHGYWEHYYPNNNLWYKGNYVNGKESGIWGIYDENCELTYKVYYIL